ncbi:hypothetical protein HanRHA438_Chr17g0809301 [Helianthus annuus]|nr:hypothetical protein HanHA300_Chr17g0651341 [Helianthus annuus]KAJ0447249.1 hypothetical protein HanHA89_Chr17g0703231 [Helianthus annuus]KAJ0632162.1 hypothetical protein HanLR1_Chr17g0661971 [Helianthus annuus]KAJ0825995.1 hypothetical protein HanRHA438_Chr17g0809301 [Helianthus annuus]
MLLPTHMLFITTSHVFLLQYNLDVCNHIECRNSACLVYSYYMVLKPSGPSLLILFEVYFLL